MTHDQLQSAASIVASLTTLYSKKLRLALDDPNGPQNYLFFFEEPADPAVKSYLISKGFAHTQRSRTPHDDEADLFINDALSTRVEFSDPNKKPHNPLWIGELPKSESFRAFKNALMDQRN